MKVCFITPYPLRMISGVSRVVIDLCKGLKERGIDHLVITARHRDDIEKDDIHHTINVAFLLGGLDMQQYFDFRREHPEEYAGIVALGREQGLSADSNPHAMPRNDVAVFQSTPRSGNRPRPSISTGPVSSVPMPQWAMSMKCAPQSVIWPPE